MPHLFAGSGGLLVGTITLLVSWLYAHRCTGQFQSFDFDAHGKDGAFEKLLQLYLHTAEVVIGLAAGSIVLLVGSSGFHSNHRLPWQFASPLLLLAFNIICGILFMTFLIVDYEAYRHQPKGNYTRFKYVRNQTLGYGALLCFCIGYTWLVIVVTR